MNDTKKKEKINAIKKNAGELFDKIEDLIEWTSPDETAELIRDELGDYLKESDGFRELRFGYELALSKSEKARNDLEGSTIEMDDQALETLFKLSTYAHFIAKEILNKDPKDRRGIHWRLKELLELGPEVRESVIYEWYGRSACYRSEIDKLKVN